MKVLAFCAFVALACATAPFHVASEPIEGHYIFVFKQATTAEAREAHYASLTLGEGEEITHKYDFSDFFGYAAKLSKENLAFVLEDELIAYGETNGMAHALNCETQTGLPQGLWGLSRTMQEDLPNRMEFIFNRRRGGIVDAYIIDTGVYCLHNEFITTRQNRCHPGHDEYPGEGGSNVDLNGHGTHVAGTVAGEKYGFCKDCNIYAVKVLSRGGSGSWAGVINGIQWVARHHNRNRRAIGNMSLGGGRQESVNQATDAAVRDGVTMVCASGNSNGSACNFSPASAPLAIAVNSMTRTDARSSFSNFGTCSHIFAPGSDVLSAWIGNPDAVSTISGTSMAAPHVAGVGAEVLAEVGGPTTPAQVKQRLIDDANIGKITNPGAGSPNLLLFHACLP
jgi:hypothetical protein